MDVSTCAATLAMTGDALSGTPTGGITLTSFDYALYITCGLIIAGLLVYRFITSRKKKVAIDSAAHMHNDNYYDVFNAASEVIFIHDAETGEILDVNKAVINLYGFAREELIGKDINQIFSNEPPYTREHAVEKIREAAKSGPLLFEWHGRRKDGSLFWHEVSLKKTRIMNRNCVLAIIRDISDRHEAETEKSRLSRIIENTADLVVTIAADQQLSYINTAGRKLLAWPEEKILQEVKFRDLHPGIAQNTVEFGLARALVYGIWQGETFIQDRNGKNIPVSEVIISHKDHAGQIEYYSAIVRDLRQQKQAENIIRDRLYILTRPECEWDNVKLTSIFDIQEIQNIQDAFAKATGVGSIITDTNGVPLTKPSNFCKLCAMVRETPEGKKRCIHSDSILNNNNIHEPFFRRCSCIGLWDGGTRMMVGGKHVANWLIGQVRDSAISIDELLPNADEAGIDRVVFRQEMEKLPTMTKEQFSGVCNSLHLLAGQLSRLVLQNIQQARIIHERDLAEKALRNNKEHLRCTLHSIGDGVIATDLEGNIITMNHAAEELAGQKETDCVNKPLNNMLIISDDSPAAQKIDLLATHVDEDNRKNVKNTYLLHRQDGENRTVAFKSTPIKDGDGESDGYVIVFRDVSKERLLEEQLRQSQKMEAVGKLAGGLAHEFNNLLQVILGYGDMLAPKLEDSKQKAMLQQVLTAGNSAKKLVRQLLAFSRSDLEPEKSITDLNPVMVDFKKMLTRLLGEHITLRLKTAETPLLAYVDSAQIEQVMMNLCLNARDAMPEGGTLNISVYEYIYDGTSQPLPDLRPGRYVCCEVSDSGCGIPAPLQQRVFEPFFTTKPLGEGTGLGLATSYAIIRKFDGIMTFTSRLGEGTTFRIMLPQIDDKHPFAQESFEEEENVAEEAEETSERQHTILLVEDEKTVRNLGQMILEDAGYQVITASNGQIGEEMFDLHADQIDLALLDLVMPVKSGREVALHIREHNPTLPIFFCSGYNDDYIKADTITDYLIHKPYDSQMLLQKIREAIALNESQNEE